MEEIDDKGSGCVWALCGFSRNAGSSLLLPGLWQEQLYWDEWACTADPTPVRDFPLNVAQLFPPEQPLKCTGWNCFSGASSPSSSASAASAEPRCPHPIPPHGCGAPGSVLCTSLLKQTSLLYLHCKADVGYPQNPFTFITFILSAQEHRLHTAGQGGITKGQLSVYLLLWEIRRYWGL